MSSKASLPLRAFASRSPRAPRSIPSRHAQQGVGLVELMLALVLGLFISAMALEYFLASRSTLNTTSAVSYLQESARHVTRRLQPLVRNAGFSGCASVSSVSDGTGSHALSDSPLTAESDTVAGITYDRLALQVPALGAQRGWQLGASVAQGDTSLTLEDYTSGTLETDSVVLISDCESGDIARLSGDGNNSLDLSSAVEHGYGGTIQTQAYVYPLQRWYLLLSQADDDSPVRLCLNGEDVDGDPAAGCGEEVARYVEALDLTFDTASGSGSASRFAVERSVAEVEAANDWSSVRRIHISLTLKTPPTINVEGEGGGELQRTFDITLSPRNIGL